MKFFKSLKKFIGTIERIEERCKGMQEKLDKIEGERAKVLAFEHRDQMVKFAASVEQFLKDKRPDYDSLRIEVKGKEIFCDSSGHSLPFAYDIVLYGEVD